MLKIPFDVLNEKGDKFGCPTPLLIAALSNVLLGYGMHGKATVLSIVVPLAVSISFFLIADIDSPRAGVIRILPRNLYAVTESQKEQ